MKLADLKKGKAVGFYVTLGLIFASLITAIVYIACFFGTDEMNYVSFAILLLGAIASGALVFFKKYTIASYVVASSIFLALLFYIYAVYYYVSVVLVGIDLDHFSAQFIITTIFFLLSFIVGVVNVFLPQVKEEEIPVESEVKE